MDGTSGLAGPKAKFVNSVVETVELVTERFSNSLHQFALIRQRRDAHRTHTEHHPELENQPAIYTWHVLELDFELRHSKCLCKY
jgi:hypothetical protein